jgi:hypothetical protein
VNIRPSVLGTSGSVLAGLVVAWRVLAYRHPSSLIAQEPGFELAVAGLGLAFAATGLAVAWLRPGRMGSLFLVWCLCSGIHWGGAIGSPTQSVELALLAVYVGLSVAGEAALLHLALAYAPEWRVPGWLLAIPYVPAALALLIAPAAGAIPKDTLGTVVGLAVLAGTLAGIAAGVVFIARWIRADRQTRHDGRLGILVACFLVAGLPSLVAPALPGPGDAYNLAALVLPLGMAYALTRGAAT